MFAISTAEMALIRVPLRRAGALIIHPDERWSLVAMKRGVQVFVEKPDCAICLNMQYEFVKNVTPFSKAVEATRKKLRD